MSEKNFVLIYGGTSVEHQISCLSAQWVFNNCPSNYTCQTVFIDRKGQWWHTTNIVDRVDPSQAEKLGGLASCIDKFGSSDSTVYFIAVHGTSGEDGSLQGAMTSLNVVFTGCDMASSAVSMDKDYSKILVQHAGLKVAPWEVTHLPLSVLPPSLTYPVFIKPARLGSSVGVSRVTDDDELQTATQEGLQFDTKLLIEGEIKGREIECAVLEVDGQLHISTPGEVITEHTFYSYKAKYQDKAATRTQVPADLTAEQSSILKTQALVAAHALGAEGFCRVDFFLTEESDAPIFNEVNTIPGLTEHSLFPRLWQYEGKSGSQVLQDIIQAGVRRWRRNQNIIRSFDS